MKVHAHAKPSVVAPTRPAAPRTNLRLGPIDDPLEREADRLAARVMGGSNAAHERARPTDATTLRRSCSACAAKDRDEVVQRQGEGGASLSADTAAAITELRSSSGQPLDPQLRARFEPRFGHDFAQVRVHADARAAATAASVQARAFTLGRDVVFGAGEYQPHTRAGQTLIAHELAHVIQQSGGSRDQTLQRQPIQELPESLRLRLGPTPYVPPPPLIQPGSMRETWVVPLPILPAPPELELPSLAPRPRLPRLVPDLALGPIFRFTPVLLLPVARCVPGRALTWADFPSSSVPGGFGAVTRARTPEIVVDGNPMFQAQLDATSAVRPGIRTPSNRAINGCQPRVNACRQYLSTHPGHRWSTARSTPDPCPASPLTISTATTVGECDTIIGPACDADKVADSARLLAHEQLHFDIPCAMVGKANDALIAGTHTSTQLAAWLRTTLPPLQARYDAESVHGCDAAGQATWVAAVAAGLPAIPLPPRTPSTP